MNDYWVRGVLDGMRDAEPMYRLGWRAPAESYLGVDDVFHSRIRELANHARDLASVKHRERLEADPDSFAAYYLDCYRTGYSWALEVELSRLARGQGGVDFTTFSDSVLYKVAAVLNEAIAAMTPGATNPLDDPNSNEGSDHDDTTNPRRD